MMEWIDVEDSLPDDGKWAIVRCVSLAEEFYLMAVYYKDVSKWNFLDRNYQEYMKVAHWTYPDPIKDEVKFTKDDK